MREASRVGQDPPGSHPSWMQEDLQVVGAKSWFSFLVCVRNGHAFDPALEVLVVKLLDEECFARLGRLFRYVAAGD